MICVHGTPADKRPHVDHVFWHGVKMVQATLQLAGVAGKSFGFVKDRRRNRGSQGCCPSIQSYIAEGSALYDR